MHAPSGRTEARLPAVGQIVLEHTVMPRDGRADGHVSHVVCVLDSPRATRSWQCPAIPPQTSFVLRDRRRDRGAGRPPPAAAVALARLGVTSSASSESVGDDETGVHPRRPRVEGADVSELAIVPGRRSPQSAIYVVRESRAIAAYRGDTTPPGSPPGPRSPSRRSLGARRPDRLRLRSA